MNQRSSGYLDDQQLITALRSLPAPEPRPGFVDRSLRNATRASHSGREPLLRSRNYWLGIAAGAAVGVIATLTLLRIEQGRSADSVISLAINEVREIDVVIDAEREMPQATLRVAALGDIALDGFESEREIDWTAHVQKGPNLLTLPVLTRNAGRGVLVAMIEHEGRQRSVIINIQVKPAAGTKS